ncbi:TlpA family protein disulfide reductase [Maribacter sp. X9]|uniref:TlpA family protein disulfide reductase n=1 Tax=Maribacter sp. X9 TaxID=3402159 RepID=UPI003AF3AEBC
MRNSFYVFALVAMVAMVVMACKKIPKDYVALSGTIIDKNSDSLTISSETYQKRLEVNSDGTFSDTLKVEKGYYVLFDGKEYTSLYLENGFDLNITLDTKAFDESIAYTGIGENANNYLAKKALMQEKVLNNVDIFDLDKEAFGSYVDAVFDSLNQSFQSLKNLDSTFIEDETKQLEQIKNYVSGEYDDKKYMETVLVRGNPSPVFEGYENYAGGKTSLEDLKGKYVYVDVWATWCVPCIQEVPFLKRVEEDYRDRDIHFVSISIDKQEDKDKWKAMIKEKDLGGIQLLTDEDAGSKFIQDYRINSIPRFLLIGPEGNIISSNAPRPSDNELIEVFNELKL